MNAIGAFLCFSGRKVSPGMIFGRRQECPLVAFSACHAARRVLGRPMALIYWPPILHLTSALVCCSSSLFLHYACILWQVFLSFRAMERPAGDAAKVGRWCRLQLLRT